MSNLESNTQQAFIALTHQQLLQIAPAIFTQDKASRTSSIYAKTSTIQIVEDLEKLGWLPVRAEQRRSKIVQGYQKHTIYFRNPSVKLLNTNTEIDEVEAYPEICLVNSHDGLTAFKLSLALYRLVCENGLTFQSELFSSHRIVHKGYNFDELEKLVISITESIPKMIEIVEEMKEIFLTGEQIEEYVDQAVQIRERYSQGTKLDIVLRDFIQPRREQDNGNSLWLIYNLTQEKLIKGGFLNTENNRTTKAITYLDKILWINKDLFELTQQYYEKFKLVGPIEGEEELKQDKEKDGIIFEMIKELVQNNKTIPEICNSLNLSKKKYYSLLTDLQKEELNEIRATLK